MWTKNRINTISFCHVPINCPAWTCREPSSLCRCRLNKTQPCKLWKLTLQDIEQVRWLLSSCSFRLVAIVLQRLVQFDVVPLCTILDLLLLFQFNLTRIFLKYKQFKAGRQISYFLPRERRRQHRRFRLPLHSDRRPQKCGSSFAQARRTANPFVEKWRT